MAKETDWDKFWGTLAIGIGAEITRAYVEQQQRKERDKVNRILLEIAKKTAETVRDNPQGVYDLGVIAQRQLGEWAKKDKTRGL